MSINTIIIIALVIMTVLVIGTFFYVYLRDKTLEDIREDVYRLFLEAEHMYINSGSGKQKMKYVIQQARRLLPAWAQIFITDDFLEAMMQKWFFAVKDLLDDGKLNGTGKDEEKLC